MADIEKHSVVIFSNLGDFNGYIPVSSPECITFGKNGLYVYDKLHKHISYFSSTGDFINSVQLYSANIRDIFFSKFNDRLYICTLDKIYTYNLNKR